MDERLFRLAAPPFQLPRRRTFANGALPPLDDADATAR